jgi:hypothetical protein
MCCASVLCKCAVQVCCASVLCKCAVQMCCAIVFCCKCDVHVCPHGMQVCYACVQYGTVEPEKRILTNMGLHRSADQHTNKEESHRRVLRAALNSNVRHSFLHTAAASQRSQPVNRTRASKCLAGPEHTRTSPVKAGGQRGQISRQNIIRVITRGPGACLSTPPRHRVGRWGVLGCRKVGMCFNAALQGGKEAQLDQKGIQPTPPSQKGKECCGAGRQGVLAGNKKGGKAAWSRKPNLPSPYSSHPPSPTGACLRGSSQHTSKEGSRVTVTQTQADCRRSKETVGAKTYHPPHQIINTGF